MLDVARRDIRIARDVGVVTTESILVYESGVSTPTLPRNGIPVSIPRDQLWFWQTGWLAGEHRASAQIDAGRVTRYADADDFFASLEARIDD